MDLKSNALDHSATYAHLKQVVNVLHDLMQTCNTINAKPRENATNYQLNHDGIKRMSTRTVIANVWSRYPTTAAAAAAKQISYKCSFIC